MPDPLVFHLDLDRLTDRAATLVHVNGGDDGETPLVVLTLAREPWQSGTERSSRVRITIERLDG
jgi:hypothetical protein